MVTRRTINRAGLALAALGMPGARAAMKADGTHRKIDVHQHLLPRAYVDALAQAGIHGAGGVTFPDWSPEAAIRMMDEQEIATGILSISTPGTHFGDDAAAAKLSRDCNEYQAALVRDHPDRFGAFAVLPMPFVEGSVTEARYALEELELDGVVLLSSFSDGSYLGDPAFDVLMEFLNERSAVAFVHPTVPVTAPGDALTIPPFATEFVFDTSRAILNLIWNGVAERYPDIRFVFSHAGGTAPYLAWRWALLDRAPQMQEQAPRGCLHYLRGFYYDTALSGSEQALGALTRLVGADRILFGSDYPFARARVSAASWAGVNGFAGFGAADKALIASGNAVELFPRLAAGRT
ncbi:MAG: amidohydrolase [Gammaproteobacteria bacterium]|nr:amidohydrolase [Gammaproteobacteria bacterium]